MKAEIMTFTYSIKWEQGKRTPIILLFLRDTNNQRFTVGVKGFKPYFYVPSGNCEMRDVYDRCVEKVEVEVPSDVTVERENYEWTDMADIPYVVNWMKTYGIHSAVEIDRKEIRPAEDLNITPKVLYMDIEVDSPEEIIPRPEDPKYPIVLISCSDNVSNEVHLFTLVQEKITEPSPEGKEFGRKEKVIVHNFDNERDLLNAWIDWVMKEDYDIITGWNLSKMKQEDMGFDWPYIFGRSRRLGVRLERISPIHGIDVMNIRGRELFDLLRAYKNYHKPLGELPTYDFKYVVKLETGYSYIDYGDRIRDLMEHDHITLLNYGYNDAIALKILEEKVHIIDFYDRLRRIAGCRIREAIFNSRIIDYVSIDLIDRPLPTRQHNEEREKGLRGAIVFEPSPGIHENVGVFDVKSMYPYIVMVYNIDSTKYGVMPKVVEYLQSQRDFWRAKRKQLEKEGKQSTPEYYHANLNEWSFKFLVASCYGVFSVPGYRLYSMECANEITKKGREILNHLAELAGRENVLYGDTDSIFIKVDSIEHGLELEKKLKDYLHSIDERFDIKFEKFYKRIFFKRRGGVPVKKRYAGFLIWKEGVEINKMDIKGFEPRRSDSAEITRETMRKFFELILQRGEIEKAFKYLRRVWDNMPFEPLPKVGIPKGVHPWKHYKVKNPWLDGVKYSHKHYKIRFREDQKPLLFYISRPYDTEVICLTHDFEKPPEGVKIDWNVMRRKVIKEKFKDILESLGYNFDVALGFQKQLRGGR